MEQPETGNSLNNMTELQKCLQLLEDKGYTDEYEVKDGKLLTRRSS